ncbi:MAG: class I SAM-dependent methyltransferase [Candidatus Bipolaricaulota bacterium]
MGGRLAWYARSATEAFWEDYWRQTVTRRAFDEAPVRLEGLRTGRALVRHLKPGGVHLEAGCGPGFWVHALRSLGLAVYGVDFSTGPLLATAAVLPGLPLAAGDVLNLPFGDASLDSYLSFGVIEHREAGPELFLREAHRVLKDTGVLVVSVPSFGLIRRLKGALGAYSGALPPNLAFYQYGFTRRELASHLRGAGFDPRESFYESAHRLLQEELPGYAGQARRRGGRHLKRLVEAVLGPIDGHMLVMVAKKVPCGRGPALGQPVKDVGAHGP